jgi:hypothetical protein
LKLRPRMPIPPPEDRIGDIPSPHT